jgi:hypothetical protein
VTFDNPALGSETMTVPGASASSLVAIGAIVILFIAAIALLIALLVR